MKTGLYGRLINSHVDTYAGMDFVPKIGNDLVDFCMNNCPHKTCKHGTCQEYRAFEKQYKEAHKNDLP